MFRDLAQEGARFAHTTPHIGRVPKRVEQAFKPLFDTYQRVCAYEVYRTKERASDELAIHTDDGRQYAFHPQRNRLKKATHGRTNTHTDDPSRGQFISLETNKQHETYTGKHERTGEEGYHNLYCTLLSDRKTAYFGDLDTLTKLLRRCRQ